MSCQCVGSSVLTLCGSYLESEYRPADPCPCSPLPVQLCLRFARLVFSSRRYEERDTRLWMATSVPHPESSEPCGGAGEALRRHSGPLKGFSRFNPRIGAEVSLILATSPHRVQEKMKMGRGGSEVCGGSMFPSPTHNSSHWAPRGHGLCFPPSLSR